ncbi:MAG: PilZ domain-containing protein [Nitrospira sp.]|nr:PilZ domain-containing protein [Nitrospira sp.]
MGSRTTGTETFGTTRVHTNNGKVTIEERQGRRIHLTCRLFFFGDDDFEGEATILDVSTTGCRATSLIEVRVGMVFKLSLFLSDYKWPLRVEQSVVRWVDGERFGLEFIAIRPAQRERLRALIMKTKS